MKLETIRIIFIYVEILFQVEIVSQISLDKRCGKVLTIQERRSLWLLTLYFWQRATRKVMLVALDMNFAYHINNNNTHQNVFLSYTLEIALKEPTNEPTTQRTHI